MLAILSFCNLSLCFVACTATEPAQLRYKFQPGQTFVYVVDQANTIVNKSTSGESTTTIKQKIMTTWTVTNVDPAGKARMNQTINWVSMNVTSNPQRLAYSIDTRDAATLAKLPDEVAKVGPTLVALTKTNVTLDVDQLGNTSNVELDKKTIDAFKGVNVAIDEKALVSMASQMLSFPESVEPGVTTWRKEQTTKQAIGEQTTTTTFTYLGPTEKDNRTVDVIRANVVLSWDTGNSPAKIEFKKQSTTSELFFDRQAGVFLGSDANQEVQMVISADNKEIEQSITSSVSLRLIPPGANP